MNLFVCQNYKVKDIPLAELDQSFAEKIAAYYYYVVEQPAIEYFTEEEWWITSIRQKMKVAFTVKLLPVAKAILEKYRIPTNRFNRLFSGNSDKVFPVASLKSSDASRLSKFSFKVFGIQKYSMLCEAGRSQVTPYQYDL